MDKIKVSAPGKIHLLGEHAVVYGKPALLTTIDKRCFVELKPSREPNVEIVSQNLGKKIKINLYDLLSKTRKANKKWEEFSITNDATILKSLIRDELDYTLLAVGVTLLYYRKTNLRSGFTLTINSAIPIGEGLGSSAAIAVTSASAVTLFLKKPFNKSVINDIAFLVEKLRHGFPSGGDNSTVCFGGLLWFRKELPTFKIIQPVPFTIPVLLARKFILIDTGKPNESTGEMVSQVRSLYQEKQLIIENILQLQEELTRRVLNAIKTVNERELLINIKEGERNLEKLGVVSNFAKNIIKKIEKSGGAAKICGGGGKTKGVGILLAYHPNTKILERVLSASHLSYFRTKLGVKGLRKEV
jgi:mevalonate kinase